MRKLFIFLGLLTFFTVNLNAQSAYCPATVGSGWLWESIVNVNVGAIDNTTTYDGGYSDYTAMTASLVEGLSAAVSVTVDQATASDAVGLYVDWNNDFVFDPVTELIPLTFDGFDNFSANLLVTAIPGTYTARFVLTDTYFDALAPCGVFTYAEIEDYTFEVLAATGCLADAGFSAEQVGYIEMEYTLGIPLVSLAGYDVDWDFGDGNTDSNLDVVSHIYAAQGTYTVACTVTDPTNALCFDSYSMPVTIGCGLTADFSFEALASLDYEFTAAETYSINGYSTIWTILDGSSQLVGSPVLNTDVFQHTFAASGTYTVVLNVEDLNDIFCYDQVQYQFEVGSCSLDADFTWSVAASGVADFTSSNTYPLATSSWLIEGSNYSGDDVQYTFAANGSYPVSHTVTSTYDAACFDVVTYNVDVQTYYCEAGVSSGWLWEFITNVSVGALNNTSSYDGGYNDYTSLSAILVDGSVAPMTVTVENATASDEVGIYVDWNNDFVFDPITELIPLTFDGFSTFTASPLIAAAEGNYRARVVLTDTYFDPLAPCGLFTYAEIEDYTFEVISPAGCIANADFSYNQVGFLDMEFSLGVPVESLAGYYVDWSFGDGSVILPDVDVATHTYASAGTYLVSATVGDPADLGCFDYYETLVTVGCDLVADYSFSALSDFDYQFTAAETYSLNGYSTIWTILDDNSQLVGTPFFNVDDLQYTFPAPGTYTVVLNVEDLNNIFCYDQVQYQFEVGVCSLDASFTALDNGSGTVYFTSNNTYSLASSIWYINGISYNSVDAQYTFMSSGTYVISHTWASDYDMACYDVVDQTISVVSPNCELDAGGFDFTWTGLGNASYDFETFLSYNPANWYIEWDFGDGNLDVSSMDEVSHTYAAAGVYTVSCYIISVWDQSCWDYVEHVIGAAPNYPCTVAADYGQLNDPMVTGTTTAVDFSHWYSFTVPSSFSGDVTVSLCGSSFDTKVAVFEDCADWDGTFASSGTYMAAGAILYNDDECGLSSEVEAALSPGTYYVMVYGYDGGDYGDYQLEITGIPFFDGCAGVQAYGNVNDPSQLGATVAPYDYQMWSFTVVNGDNVTIQTCGAGTNYDTKLALFNDCADWTGDLPSLYTYASAGAIAYNDDYCGLSSGIEEYLTPGTYYVLVYGFSSNYGSYELEITSPVCELTSVAYTTMDMGNCTYEFYADQPYYASSGYDVEWYVNGQPYAQDVDMISYSAPVSGAMQIELVVTNTQFANCSASYSTQVSFMCPCSVDADFSYTDLSDLDFEFTSTMAYDPSVYNLSWDFGDGSPVVTGASSLFHTFATIGTFNVTFMVEDPSVPNCYDMHTEQVYAFACFADASYSWVDYGNGMVDFATDMSFDPNNYAIDWYFGDGATLFNSSTATHNYAQTGTYVVQCWVTSLWDFSCYDYVAETIYFHVCDIDAEFTAVENSYAGSGEYTFATLDSFDPLMYDIQWTFGDGNTASGSDTEIHQYAATGMYTVDVAISDLNDPLCFDDYSMSVDATVLVCDLNVSFTSTSDCLDFDFTANMVYDPLTYDVVWNFGDGSSEMTNVSAASHTYAAQGNYDVTLTVTHKVLPGCTQMFSAQVFADDCIVDWTYTNTGVSHSILIPTQADLNVNGGPIAVGDYIGVFFLDDNNVEACGGYVAWMGNNEIMTAWGDDSQTTAKDGFGASEVFVWKIWQATTNTEHTVAATYMPAGQFGITDTDMFASNGLSGLEGLGAAVTVPDVQTLTLAQGWGMFSTYIIPTMPLLTDVFSSISSEVNIVKDEMGATYWPIFGVNSIGSLTIGEGYQISMNSAQTLDVVGTAVNPEVWAIDLPSGWSMFGYLRQTPQDIAVALSSVVAPAYMPGHLIIVKDGSGNQFWPYWGINNINNLNPGQGYQVLMNTSQSFYYQANGPVNTAKVTVQPNPSHFNSMGNTGSNMSLLIPETAWSFDLTQGDEVGIKSGDVVIGSGVYNGSNLAITLWGDNNLTAVSEGVSEGTPFVISYFDTESNAEFALEVETWIEGEATFTTNGVAVVGKFAAPVQLISSEMLSQNWPNPFKEQTTIQYYLPNEGNVHIAIYNALGMLMEVAVNEKTAAGTHEVIIDAASLAAGKYYYRMTTDANTYTKAMTVSSK